MINNLKGIHGNQTKLSSIFNNPNMNVKKFTKFGSQNILKCCHSSGFATLNSFSSNLVLQNEFKIGW